MKITLGEQQYVLGFAHHIQGPEPGTWLTQARLEKVGTEFMVDDYAVCQPGDQYCKAVGRKIALTRLLEKLPRPARAQVWKQYWHGIGKDHFNDSATA